MNKTLLYTCLALTLVGVLPIAANAQDPGVEVTTDTDSYVFGESIDVILSVANGDAECEVDFYLALIAPDGAPYFYPDWDHPFEPCMSGVTLPADFAMGPFLFISCSAGGTSPPLDSEGTYAFAAALMAAGSDELLQEVSFAFFDVTSSAGECPPGMVRIPAGTFLMGDTSGVGYIDEYPQHIVTLDAFCIDIYEYPNQAGVVPDSGISWVEANQVCATQGKRLCSEAEWEKTCKGPLGWIYTYGDSYDGAKCWTEVSYGDNLPGASGTRTRCTNDYGVFDMSGNVPEWVSDFYSAEYYSQSPYENPTGPEVGSFKLVRGGAWFEGGLTTRCSFRYAYDAERPGFSFGTRCCSD